MKKIIIVVIVMQLCTVMASEQQTKAPGANAARKRLHEVIVQQGDVIKNLSAELNNVKVKQRKTAVLARLQRICYEYYTASLSKTINEQKKSISILQTNLEEERKTRKGQIERLANELATSNKALAKSELLVHAYQTNPRLCMNGTSAASKPGIIRAATTCALMTSKASDR